MQSKFISSQNIYINSFQDYAKFQISKRQKDQPLEISLQFSFCFQFNIVPMFSVLVSEYNSDFSPGASEFIKI